jgi:adenylate cyclase
MKRLIFIVFIILALPLLFQLYPLQILKLQTFDTFVKKHDPSGNFVVLNITQEDIQKSGGWPFPRQELAQIHVDILNAGAMGVGWVVSLPNPDRFGGDEMFLVALDYSPSILAMFEYDNGKYPPTSGTVLLGDNISGIMAKGVVQNDPIFTNVPQGLSTAPTEIDNLVRRMPLLMETPDGFVASFGTEVLKVLAGAKTYIIKGDDNGMRQITVQGLPPVDVDSLGRKWISWVDTPQTDLQELNVAHKFVFVSVNAPGVFPQVATPVGLLSPHQVQAALAESILIQDSPFVPDWAIAAELIMFVICLIIVSVIFGYLGMTQSIIFGGLFMAATFISGVYIIKSGYLVDFSWTFISEFVQGSAIFYMRFRQQYKLRQQIKKQFEHYLDPRQVKQLQDDPSLLKLGGEKKYCSFLFTDLRGFTALSEKLPPEEVTDIMNKTLTVQVNAVQKLGGMTDKFIGDAGMFIFGAPLDLEDHETKAVQAAIDIQKGIAELNKTLSVPVAVGVGTQAGVACIGNMGSDTRFDYSAIGDPVNTAARLESATKEVGVDILIGENIAKNCKFVLKSLKPIKVKGKKEALKIWTIS